MSVSPADASELVGWVVIAHVCADDATDDFACEHPSWSSTRLGHASSPIWRSNLQCMFTRDKRPDEFAPHWMLVEFDARQPTYGQCDLLTQLGSVSTNVGREFNLANHMVGREILSAGNQLLEYLVRPKPNVIRV